MPQGRGAGCDIRHTAHGFKQRRVRPDWDICPNPSSSNRGLAQHSYLSNVPVWVPVLLVPSSAEIYFADSTVWGVPGRG
jgi:hypothetical protein